MTLVRSAPSVRADDSEEFSAGSGRDCQTVRRVAWTEVQPIGFAVHAGLPIRYPRVDCEQPT